MIDKPSVPTLPQDGASDSDLGSHAADVESGIKPPLGSQETSIGGADDIQPADATSDDACSVDSSDSSESSMDSDAEDGPPGSDAQPVSVATGSAKPGNDVPGPCWVNSRSRTIHKIGMTEVVTYCGRRVAAGNFTMFPDGASSLNPRCSFCYKGELITAREGLSNRLQLLLQAKQA